MSNPYETPSSGGASCPANTASRMRILTPCRLLITIHGISTLLVIAMCAGGFVTYAPTITQYEMQNIYLTDMLLYGSGVAILQIVGICLAIRIMKSPPSDPSDQ